MKQLTPEMVAAARAQGLSVYRMRGTDKIVYRRHRDPLGDKIKQPRYENMRRINAEFGGRSTAANWISLALQPLKHIADRTLISPLNTLLRPVQDLDTVSSWGQKNVLISSGPGLLEGFNFNSEHSLESMLRQSLSFEISKETWSAKVMIPALLPGRNFINSSRYSWYRITAVLGIVPDLYYTANGYRPIEKMKKQQYSKQVTDWKSFKSNSDATTFELTLPDPGTSNHCSLLLAVGVSLGTVTVPDFVDTVRNVGAAKIIGAA